MFEKVTQHVGIIKANQVTYFKNLCNCTDKNKMYMHKMKWIVDYFVIGENILRTL